MAGAGKKTFSAGETLLASDVNNFLMDQTIMVFDSASDRSTDLPTPSEGMVSYLKDVGRYDKYTGSGWVEFAATTLEDLTDTDITTPASDEFLRYDGTDWVNTVADATTSTAGVVLGTTSDGFNTALGDGALESNTTGGSNTASGYAALLNNTTGDRNTASGYQALQDNTTGNFNTASGYQALLNNTTGNFNTASGYAALQSNTTGDRNTASGYQALRFNTTGNFNTASGYQALRFNTTGDRNTASGYAALQSNTTGDRNTASGYQALRNNTTGGNNTASGYQALQSNTTGDFNTASGYQALRNNTEGSNNTAFGYRTGDVTTTGSNNSTLGFGADPSSATASNQVTLGDGSITSLRCNQTSISSLSDVRDKTDIETTTLGLDVINQVRPVEFTWARRDGTMGDTPDLGFIAQELAEVEDDLGETDRLRLTLRDNPEKLEASPNRLLPVLVKAVQELSAQNDELRARLDAVEGN